ncbi:MAG: ribonuclease J, partial [Alphaproteobacteria bacterium]
MAAQKKNQKKEDKAYFPDDTEGLYFIPLGGAEQFGVNLNVYIDGTLSKGRRLAVDCGIGFADERFPGIDLLLPDPAFLEAARDQLDGLVITQAHEDHIGAVALLWKRLRCPVYASPFTAAVLAKKLEEQGEREVPVHVVDHTDPVQIGAFSVQFVPVAHSVPDTRALIIETGNGRVVHSGDWNLDPHPVTGQPTDPAPFKAVGDKGVLAYIGDSTNAGVSGRSGSESAVAEGLEATFKACRGRIAVTSFSSNIGRVISIAKAAQACGRQVAVIGRSLHRMIGCARECGYMKDVPDFISEEEAVKRSPEEIVLIVTGSQGEARAALAKIARGEHPSVTLSKGDTVVFSARAIPGNERDINHVKNNLMAGGVHIISPGDTPHIIHVSGHPCREEILEMYQWTRPQIVVPVHGERVQLEAQAALARDCQIQDVLIPVNGSVIRLAPGKAEIVDHVETGLLAVETKRVIEASHAAIAERRKLQYSGAVHIALAVGEHGRIVGDPKLDMVGLIDTDSAGEEQIREALLNEIFELVEDMTLEERE